MTATPTGLGRFVGKSRVGDRANAPTAFAQRRPSPAGEVCEMCAAPIAEAHRHVVHLEERRLLCTCTACALLFTQPGAGRGAFRAVPDRYAVTALDQSQWEALQVPVATAFFFVNSTLGRVVGQYPSPAGATESLLDLRAWDAIAADNAVAAALEPDVEALVVHRGRDGEVAAYLVPIDACYELVGALRLHWTGFDGGAEARADIETFFDSARRRSRPIVGGGE